MLLRPRQKLFVERSIAALDTHANTLGVARTAAVSGDKIPVDVLGTVVIESGAAFSAGATLKADASGRGIVWVTSGAKIALALEAATGAGQFVEAVLIPNVA